MTRWLFAFALVLGFAYATPLDEGRVRALGLELKCPVCQGSAIAESPSEFAKTMMTELREQVRQGKSDGEIIDFFVAKYGEDTRLRPNNPLVWALPLVVMVGVAVGLLTYLRRASQAKPVEVSQAALEKVRQMTGQRGEP